MNFLCKLCLKYILSPAHSAILEGELWGITAQVGNGSMGIWLATFVVGVGSDKSPCLFRLVERSQGTVRRVRKRWKDLHKVLMAERPYQHNWNGQVATIRAQKELGRGARVSLPQAPLEKILQWIPRSVEAAFMC